VRLHRLPLPVAPTAVVMTAAQLPRCAGSGGAPGAGVGRGQVELVSRLCLHADGGVACSAV
jgi:hypothetical protein